MKMVEKGDARLVKLKDGKYRLEVPVDFEFESDSERQEVEDAFQKVIAERMRRLRVELDRRR